MSLDDLFSLCNVGVLPGWIVLVFAPRWRLGTGFLVPLMVPCALAIVYLAVGIVALNNGVEGGFSTLDSVSLLFGNRYLVVAGWVHYLAFDLVVGCWEVRDAQRLGIHHLLVVPCLALTFLAGLVGFLLYVLLRLSIKRDVFVGERCVPPDC